MSVQFWQKLGEYGGGGALLRLRPNLRAKPPGVPEAALPEALAAKGPSSGSDDGERWGLWGRLWGLGRFPRQTVFGQVPPGV